MFTLISNYNELNCIINKLTEHHNYRVQRRIGLMYLMIRS